MYGSLHDNYSAWKCENNGFTVTLNALNIKQPSWLTVMNITSVPIWSIARAQSWARSEGQACSSVPAVRTNQYQMQLTAWLVSDITSACSDTSWSLNRTGVQWIRSAWSYQNYLVNYMVYIFFITNCLRIFKYLVNVALGGGAANKFDHPD